MKILKSIVVVPSNSHTYIYNELSLLLLLLSRRRYSIIYGHLLPKSEIKIQTQSIFSSLTNKGFPLFVKESRESITLF